MSITLILGVTFIQFVVQYVLYRQVVKRLYEFHSKHLSTLKALPTELFFINVGCTVIVCLLTSAGFITGITNLFASALLGFVMSMQYKSYRSSLLDGSYYRKLKERKDREADEQEFLDQIARKRRENRSRGYF